MDVSQEVLTRLDKLAEVLGETASEGAGYFWPKLVQQQVYTGTIGTTVTALLTVAALTMFVLLARSCAKLHVGRRENDERYDGSWIVGVVFSVVLSVAVVVIGLYLTANFLLRALTPEYYALMEIVGAL